nr:hypothetical protein [Nannocystis exedens]
MFRAATSAGESRREGVGRLEGAAPGSPGSLAWDRAGGCYRLDDVLGHGGMGSVYVAKDTLLGQRHALKVLSPELARDRSFVERFLREAQMIAQLQHPNFVDIHILGEDLSGIVFFTMELLEGEDKLLTGRLPARAGR